MHDNAIVGPHARLQAHVQKLKPSTEHGQAWSIEVLKEQIASMRGRELPGFPKPEVMSLFVRKFVADWREPTGTLIKEVQAIVLDVCRCSAVNQPSHVSLASSTQLKPFKPKTRAVVLRGHYCKS